MAESAITTATPIVDPTTRIGWLERIARPAAARRARRPLTDGRPSSNARIATGRTNSKTINSPRARKASRHATTTSRSCFFDGDETATTIAYTAQAHAGYAATSVINVIDVTIQGVQTAKSATKYGHHERGVVRRRASRNAGMQAEDMM